MSNILVLGSGAWGCALANLLADNENSVTIYGIDENEINDINNNHLNSKYFNDVKINENIKATNDLISSLNNIDLIVLAIPSFAIKEMVLKIKNRINKNTIIVNVAKGFDEESKKPLANVIKDNLDNEYRGNVVSLLGPTFASEVIIKQYTAITVSGEDIKILKKVQRIFSNGYFRVYITKDYIGAEYCAALKNVIALASGMVEGQGLKNNTKAALITRGLAEIMRFVKYFNGKEKTCFGLAGVGDLMLTCSSTTSRNYSAGYFIGKNNASLFFKENKKTVEGVFACKIAYKIANDNNIYAPIVTSVYNVLFNNSNVKDEIDKLMTNDLKEE